MNKYFLLLSVFLVVLCQGEFCTPSFNVSHPTPYYNFYMQAADPTIRLKRKNWLYNFLKKHGLGYDKNKAHCMIY
uniref:Secreted protein n=1 Tax=Bursaphelenchus xylophilus TaxID=6326 RepID=A0A1I7RUB4_BURXY